MSETLAIGQLTDQYIGRTVAINDAAGRLAEGRLVGVHSMLGIEGQHEHEDWFAPDVAVEVLDA